MCEKITIFALENSSKTRKRNMIVLPILCAIGAIGSVASLIGLAYVLRENKKLDKMISATK